MRNVVIKGWIIISFQVGLLMKIYEWKLQLGTYCASESEVVKSIIRWEKRLATSFSLSSMAFQPSWYFFSFLVHFVLSFIPLLYSLSLFLLPYSALISASWKMLAVSDPSLIAKLCHVRIQPYTFWAAISLPNTSSWSNWALFHYTIFSDESSISFLRYKSWWPSI